LSVSGMTVPWWRPRWCRHISFRDGLSAICAATARDGLDDFDLFILVADDEVTDEDGAVHARVGAQALETGVVRLYSVVVILSGWMRGCARLCGVHS
jgi:hypothetical protein